MPFWASIAVLSLVQGLIVALPRARVPPALRRLRSPLWALVPAASVIAFVLVAQIAERGSVDALTYLALIAVPLLAASSLGWLAHGGRPPIALLAAPLFALAWADRGGLAGQAAAVTLSALSCIALGALIGAVTPARWLGLGIVAMALADAALVVSDQLQRPNSALNAAHPAGGLPRLQVAIFGSASMGYGDLFIAGVLGGLLAFRWSRSHQLLGAVLAASLALAFDLLFFLVDELPATVPVAGALVILELARRHPSASRLGLWRPDAA
ncbi:MAG: hypothetical protein ACTHM1_08825 [Solirubrobacteraceae bacterium]